MNGIGNEIAVLDLRGTDLTVSGAEARAIARGEGLAFDQLMVLHEPRSAGTDAFMTIYNRDGSQAESCGNGTRCVAFILMRGTPREKLVLETAAARLECWRRAETVFTVDMGRPRFAWNEIPLRDPFHDTRTHRIANWPDRCAHLAHALGREHGQSACDFLGRRYRGL